MPPKRPTEDRQREKSPLVAEKKRPRKRGAVDAIAKAANEQLLFQEYLAGLADALSQRLKTEGKKMRPKQRQSFQKLIAFIRSGKFQGLIKQPTGSGKTRLFAEILAAINKPSLVLVPRVNLVQDTKEEFVGNA